MPQRLRPSPFPNTYTNGTSHGTPQPLGNGGGGHLERGDAGGGGWFTSLPNSGVYIVHTYFRVNAYVHKSISPIIYTIIHTKKKILRVEKMYPPLPVRAWMEGLQRRKKEFLPWGLKGERLPWSSQRAEWFFFPFFWINRCKVSTLQREAGGCHLSGAGMNVTFLAASWSSIKIYALLPSDRLGVSRLVVTAAHLSFYIHVQAYGTYCAFHIVLPFTHQRRTQSS